MGRPRVDDERHGVGYAARRRADPRIAARIHAALGDARTVVNVGPGAGSYEPVDRTFDLDALPDWQHEHLAEGLRIERPRFPTIDAIAAALGGRISVESIPTPADCTDGFFDAFWNRPEALLDPAVRAVQSMWALLPAGVEERIVARLRAALESGAWDAAHGHLREARVLDGSLRLVISRTSG
jgi:hypothetical protein